MTANKVVGSNKIVLVDRIVYLGHAFYHSNGTLTKIVCVQNNIPPIKASLHS